MGDESRLCDDIFNYDRKIDGAFIDRQNRKIEKIDRKIELGIYEPEGDT